MRLQCSAVQHGAATRGATQRDVARCRDRNAVRRGAGPRCDNGGGGGSGRRGESERGRWSPHRLAGAFAVRHLAELGAQALVLLAQRLHLKPHGFKLLHRGLSVHHLATHDRPGWGQAHGWG
eukprot:363195-Chlamydomonas_euryale.AAC.4